MEAIFLFLILMGLRQWNSFIDCLHEWRLAGTKPIERSKNWWMFMRKLIFLVWKSVSREKVWPFRDFYLYKMSILFRYGLKNEYLGMDNRTEWDDWAEWVGKSWSPISDNNNPGNKREKMGQIGKNSGQRNFHGILSGLLSLTYNLTQLDNFASRGYPLIT